MYSIRFIAGAMQLIVLSCAYVTLIAYDASGQSTQAYARHQVGSNQSEGSRRMAAELKQLAEDVDPRTNKYVSAARAELYRAMAHQAESLQQQTTLNLLVAHETLLSGNSHEAIELVNATLDGLRERGVVLGSQSQRLVDNLLALAHLRIGEQENCLAHHNVDSCIMPIQASGVHTLQRGSRGAIEYYSTLLNKFPASLSYRWLLNLAYQTVGEYPDGVPEQWRIDPEVFESQYDLPRFQDVAMAAGVGVNELSGGCALDDFDGDGLIDIVASSWGLSDQLRFFKGSVTGRFVDRTTQSGLTGIVSGLNIYHADYDNDGDNDVLVLRGAWLGPAGLHPNSLLRNNGDGTFDDVTKAAGVLSRNPTQAASWADFDNDGWLDLFIGNESRLDDVRPCELYRNNKDGTFVNVAADVGLDQVGFVKAVAWGDYDNDGRADLFLSRMGDSNQLYHNDGPDAEGEWRFTDVSAAAGISGPLNSFPCWFFDYDNDGLLDILAASFASFEDDSLEPIVSDYLSIEHDAEGCSLYHNNGDGTFTDVAAHVGLDVPVLAMGANFGDLDNDGFLDCYFGTGQPNLATLIPNRMFRNRNGASFADVTTSGGFGHIQKGHGIAFADVDNDGHQDIYAVMGGAYEGDFYPNVLFLNPGNENNWVTLKLVGTTSNRSAIGARVRVRIAQEEEQREIHATVNTGGSFGSSSLQQEIGLGTADRIIDVTVTWPATGRSTTYSNLNVNTTYVLTEGIAVPRQIQRPTTGLASLQLQNTHDAHDHGSHRGHEAEHH